MPTPTAALTAAQIAQFRRDGWTLMPAVVPPAHLALLRGCCQAAVARMDAAMDAQGSDVLGLNRRGRRYFADHPSHDLPEIYDFIYSPLLAGVCRDLLGPQAHILYEQYVVKAGDGGDPLAWHQDGAYIGFEHPPYLTCWVALDDMSAANGTISVLPFLRAPSPGRPVPHRRDPVLNDLVGYDGPDPGEQVVCPAGSIALFSSTTLHRSGANRTPQARRVYLIQYCAEMLRTADGRPWQRPERFLRDGQVVGERQYRRQ